jgi:hypothetical protein
MEKNSTLSTGWQDPMWEGMMEVVDLHFTQGQDLNLSSPFPFIVHSFSFPPASISISIVQAV